MGDVAAGVADHQLDVPRIDDAPLSSAVREAVGGDLERHLGLFAGVKADSGETGSMNRALAGCFAVPRSGLRRSDFAREAS